MKKNILNVIILTLAFISSSIYADDILILRAGHSANIDEPYHKGLEKFAEIVDKETKGKVKIEIFPNNQLGNEKEMIEGTMLGTLDITVPTNGVLTNFVKELSIFDLPFLFKNRQQMYSALDGVVGSTLSQSMQKKGFRLLGFYEAGARQIITKSPINSIEDLVNKKIRTMQIPAHVESFNLFGANATPIAYGELYSALQSGVVDGAEAAYTNYQSKRFYEVAPYLAEVNWTILVADLIMSEQKFQSLSKDIQDALLKAGKESAEYERYLYSTKDKEIKKKLIDQGVIITYPNVEPFKNKIKVVYDKYEKDKNKKHLLKLIKQSK